MTEHQHEYCGGICLCGKKQPIYRDGKEVSQCIKSDVKIAYKPPQAQKKAYSEFQYNTQLLLDCLGVETKEFPKYCGFVKRIGVKNIHKVIKEIESADKWCRETHHQPLDKIGFFINNWVKLKK